MKYIWYRRISSDERDTGILFLFLLILLPFFICGLLLKKYADMVCGAPGVSVLVYVAYSVLVCIIVQRKINPGRYKALGIIGSFINMIPVAAVQMLYLIPYIKQKDEMLISAFEWIIVTLLAAGVTIFIFSLYRLKKNGAMHLLLSVIYAGIVFAILFTQRDMPMDEIALLYK